MKGKILHSMGNGNKLTSIRNVKQLSKNAEFSFLGVISKVTRRVDRNDKPFWELNVIDPSGDLDGKVWSNASWWNNQGGDKFPIDPDNCGFGIDSLSIGVIGHVTDFKDQLQYSFDEIYILDQNKYPPQKFARRSPIQQDFLEKTFNDLVNEISYKPLQDFIKAVFFKHNLWEKYKEWPAAVTIHHAYSGGLLEHSISVAIGARDIAKHYEAFKIPVNKNLLIAGALLHDIGKIKAYRNIPVPQVQTQGNVIEHVSLGYAMFSKFADLEDLEDDIALALGHIILSHHGRYEYGSPVLPETPEAMIVSAADDIDFQLAYWKEQTSALNAQNEVTEFMPLIQRRLWRGIKPR